MGYTYLAIAIIAEVIGTSALKASDQFSNPGPSVVVVIGYGLSFYFLSLVLKLIPIGIAYAIWAGVGIVLITLIGTVLFRQMLDFPALIGISLIVCGVVVINVFSSTTSA